MKTVSITFALTLDVSCADDTDPEALAQDFLQSDRFSTYQLEGEPDCLLIAGAHSSIEGIQEFEQEVTTALAG